MPLQPSFSPFQLFDNLWKNFFFLAALLFFSLEMEPMTSRDLRHLEASSDPEIFFSSKKCNFFFKLVARWRFGNLLQRWHNRDTINTLIEKKVSMVSKLDYFESSVLELDIKASVSIKLWPRIGLLITFECSVEL